MDKTFSDLKSGNLVRRVLFGETKSDDWKNVDYRNPEVLAKYVNQFAKDGGKELVKNLIKPSPVVVTVTGAAGQIAYSLLFRIANGDMLGADQPVILRLLERPEAMGALSGVVMELQDGAFPLLKDIITTDSVEDAFKGCDYAVLVGAKPRGPGMERADLLKENAKIFAEQGKALNKYANSDVLTLVVGNPANTNCLITAMNAKDIPKENFSAMTRLDHDRGLALIAQKFNVRVDEIDRFAVWGNHSATMFPDVNHTRVRGVWLRNRLTNGQNSAEAIQAADDWIYKEFVPKVQQRGAAIINARGKSSAASAADAAIKHMRDWVLGSDQWLSMGVYSNGIYGTPMGIYCSYPVKCFGAGEYGIVDGLPIDTESAKRINASCLELVQEKQAIEQLLPNTEYRFYTLDKAKVYSPEYFLPYQKQQEQLKQALTQNSQQ